MEALDRPFKVIAFDWDGTAVMSRQEDASPVQTRLERLLDLGVRVVIITGTNYQNIDRQIASRIRSRRKEHLFVCTDRGSEVHGFDRLSQPRLLLRRTATADEERELDAITERLRQRIESGGRISVDVISSRLNRRKIDLIPLPEWRDPPKSQIGELLRAVERRLQGGGIAGGVREVLAMASVVAAEVGMRDPRITSDAKHIEVGLTDKGDAVDWMMREVVANGGLSPEDVLIVGDEFGPIDGFTGSDYLMVRSAARGVRYLSVGKEPNGVPAEVIHVGGGPERFRQLLDELIAAHEREAGSAVALGPAAAAPEAAAIPAEQQAARDGWLLVEDGFNPAREHEIESIFSVGNGYLGTRASLQELLAISRPATFMAGVFTKLERVTAVPELVKAPDWARLRVFVDGEELRVDEEGMLEHRRTLDLKRGMLLREWRHKDAVGRITRLCFLRFASLADRHVLAESVSITPENYGGYIAVESALDGALAGPEGIVHLAPPEGSEEPVVAIRVPRSGVVIALGMATLHRPFMGGQARLTTTRTERSLAQRWEWAAEMGHEYHVDKLVAAYTSREVPNPATTAARHVVKLREEGLEALGEAHERAWAQRWEEAGLSIGGDRSDQRAIRFATYHLVSAADPADPRVSIGARGLTGEAYKGHVFWDTEIFMLPFFTFTHPAAARTLLSYRYHTLRGAQERAREMGYRGALYAWESTDTGEDVTPSKAFTAEGKIVRILCGEIEHHISADVAYGVWQYWRATGDDGFLLENGAEIIFETARFWASRVTKGSDGLYHILGVIGPDEYHEAVDDNAFTNVMAQWNIEQALEIVALLRQRWPERWAAIAGGLGVNDRELEWWRAIVAGMYTGFDPASGLFEQFKGYFDLEYIDIGAYEPRTAPMDVILGRERAVRAQVIKQADVVMLMYLLWDRFPPEVREANFRYYEKRCDHGSSLSPAVHGAVAARLGDLALAARYFKQTASIDLANNMGNAAGGVHMAAQGALWQAAVLGFGGMSLREDGLGFDVRLAPSWSHLAFPVQWQGRRLRLEATREPNRVAVTLETGAPMTVVLGSEPPRRIEAGGPGVVGRWSEPQRVGEV